MTGLYWLPAPPADWRERLRSLPAEPAEAWNRAVALANTRLDFVQTGNLDAAVRRVFAAPPEGLPARPVRLAVLGSCTMSHLLPAVRVAGLRRGLWIDIHEGDYGQYLQDLADPGSSLHGFAPTALLLAFDAHHLAGSLSAAFDESRTEELLDDTARRLRETWRLARRAVQGPVVQQTILPVHPPLFGNNEHRLPGSRARFIARLNERLRIMAEQEGVDLLAIDDRAARDGLAAWHDPSLWHHAKQEIAPPAAPLYGDLLGRLLAARQGSSRKCLVLDLDNTLWGGVVGDDGLDGLVLGQGSALGEAYVAVQDHARELARRGIILAVCSKNDERNALEPFDKHPDMILRREDIACFVANWEDKAANLRTIARSLNIGLESLVFLDDNPFERELVRRELPMVAVPEVADDPALYPGTLADAGYFEGVSFTGEDRERAGQYRGNLEREALKEQATDLPAYLRGLNMRLVARPFDDLGKQRIVQLINKSNQFNLTTRRYSDAEVEAVMADPRAFGLQFRLIDRFGDNGVIAIVICRLRAGNEAVIDTWLMSCRVLGRQVEQATLDVIVERARALGVSRLVGEYFPTAKNGMVKDHYAKLGFSGGILDLAGYRPAGTFIQVEQG